MSNNNFLWENVLAEIKKEISEKVFETWFLHSSIEKVDFVNKVITLFSNNSLVSDYLKNIYDSRIKEVLKATTAIDFDIIYTFIGDTSSQEQNVPNYNQPKFSINEKFLEKDKPSGIQKFAKQPEFLFEDYKEPIIPTVNTVITKKSNSSLNKNFTFDNFVIGEGNKYACNIALSAAAYPGSHNPIFIYGGVGLGKTHLLHAIGNELQRNNPHFKIKCISSETFLNEFMQSIRPGKDSKNRNLDEEFRNKYRKIDALLIDDIQFFADKKETQNAFFHTFNELQANNKQIVLISDRRPGQLNGLEDRLVSRFDSGVIADITPPDYETRFAIIKFKCTQNNLHLEDSIISYISGNISGNIRILEGIVKDLSLIYNMNKLPITLEKAEEVLNRRMNTVKKKINADDIITIVANYYKVSVQNIMSSKRNKEIAFPRMVAIYLCRELTDLSLPSLGKLFNKDHSSIFYANSKIASLVTENENNIKDNLEDIKAILQSN